MPNYKVGDVASLFPAPPAKGLQSLFQDHYGRNNSGKQIFKKKKFEKSAGNVILSKAASVKPEGEIKSNESAFPYGENKITKVKKPRHKKSEGVAFIRTSKSKRQKKEEEHHFPHDMDQDLESEELFQTQPLEKANKRIKKHKKQKNREEEPNEILDDPPVPEVESFSGEEEDDDDAVLTEDVAEVKKVKPETNEDLQCTLFIGNLPITVNKKKLLKLFRPFGPLKSVRLRGAISSKSSIPKKVAEITNKYHKSQQSHKGFVVFKDEEAAKNAISLNGTLIGNHHILVDFATQAGGKKKYNDNLSIFIGNLPFDIDDETVWSAFEECGDVQAVRVIRDQNTGLGKGFGYVLFKEIESKKKALAITGLQISGRTVRIKSAESDPHKKKGSKDTVKMIRNKVALSRPGNKKSVKKLLSKGRLQHQKKKVARIFENRFSK